MKIIINIVSILVALFCLTGCSDKLLSYMEKNSGVYESEQYLKYLSYNYAPERDNDAINVTYSKNMYIDTNFYYDDKFENLVDFTECVLKPGSVLYFDNITVNNPKTEQYKFSRFNILEFDDENNRTCVYDDWSDLENNIAVRIPEDYTGHELSIQPVGIFVDRIIELNDYYVNKDGNEVSLDYEWQIDDTTTHGNQTSIGANNSYSVKYVFDKEKFYFIGAYINNKVVKTVNPNPDLNGIVVFEISEANDNHNSFSVQLGELKEVSVSVKNPKNGTYTLNGTEDSGKLSKDFIIDNLKNGDKLVFTTPENTTITVDKVELVSQKKDDLYVYTYIINSNRYFVFNPKDYKFKNGKLVFKYKGEEIKDEKVLEDGSIIEIEANADKGYRLSGDVKTIEVKGEQTKEAINSLKFIKSDDVVVNLKKDVIGGDIIYSIDGERIIGKSVKVSPYEIINIKLEPWNGWKINSNIEEKEFDYTVKEIQNQDIHFNYNGFEINVNDLFKETSDNKPNLTVELTQNLKDVQMLVKVYESGTQINGKKEKYSTPFGIGNSEICNKKIDGTVNGVMIKVLPEDISLIDKAVKLNISKCSKNVCENDIIYITSLPDDYTIDIYDYDSKSIAHKSVSYDSLNVVIDLVDIEKFKNHDIENGTIRVLRNDVSDRREVNYRDYLESSTELKVVITPNAGYFVSGNDTSYGTSYTKILTYEKFKKEIENIIKDHEIKKQVLVNFNTEDSYGECIYLRENGDSVSGKVFVNDGENITIKYKVKTDGYQIETTGIESVINMVTGGKKEITVTRKVTSKDHSKTISIKDFGIKVVKGK